LNLFDKNILLFLNSFVGRWPHLDVFLVGFQNNNLLSGAIFVAMVWYLWFAYTAEECNRQRVREIISATICAMAVGLLIARGMAKFLPFRLRPLHNPELHLQLPDGVSPHMLENWSAFPSDHGVVWFSLAIGIYLANRMLGAAALLYAAFLGLGRVYITVHNPTDMIAGAAIGVVLTVGFCLGSVRSVMHAPIEKLHDRYPGWFYAGAFLVTYEMADMFNGVLSLAKLTIHAVDLAL
jgi:undecaprenyl-diphosphatase